MNPHLLAAVQRSGLDPTTIQTLLAMLEQAGKATADFLGPLLKQMLESWLLKTFGGAAIEGRWESVPMHSAVAGAVQRAALDPTTIQQLLSLLIQLGGVVGPFLKELLEGWLLKQFPPAPSGAAA